MRFCSGGFGAKSGVMTAKRNLEELKYLGAGKQASEALLANAPLAGIDFTRSPDTGRDDSFL